MELKNQFNQLLFQGYEPEEAKEMLQNILEMTLLKIMQNGASQAELLKVRQEYEQEIEKCLLG